MWMIMQAQQFGLINVASNEKVEQVIWMLNILKVEQITPLTFCLSPPPSWFISSLYVSSFPPSLILEHRCWRHTEWVCLQLLFLWDNYFVCLSPSFAIYSNQQYDHLPWKAVVVGRCSKLSVNMIKNTYHLWMHAAFHIRGTVSLP